MLIERFTRMGFGNLLGSVLGVAGLLWAWNIALGTEDTFAVLVAVLDTNFWLSTHVICVSLGYSATFAAGTLGAVYILNPVLRPIVFVVGFPAVGRYLDGLLESGYMMTGCGLALGAGTWLYAVYREFQRASQGDVQHAGSADVWSVMGRQLTLLSDSHRQELPRLIYGTVCFGLLFSFVGTVLGGLWADDSWGRFWGWDPKENGALMIVLWNAVVLHARWGGLVRQRGMAALAVLGNAVTVWSWEGVNQLGVGLHAYGLSDASKFRMIVAFWLAQFVIAGFALIPLRYWWSHSEKQEV
jgi:ABC-type transport system involved in cytochrome c biogenesis permease subunit